MVTTDEVLAGVRDVDYPAGKEDLLRAAERSGAGEDVLRALRALPTEEYANAEEVSRSVATDEPRDARTAGEQARGQSTSRIAASERDVPEDPLAGER
ncbi:DUF2795 domain-containing protein [Kineococcus sp. SYSU DK004]|uniref:DUF2795 domain-containing protein n=1 Tax=Kineococcus sp. SYSU DK004 TaxID=3383125 RepID=UPI003D7DA8A0